jgi:hypothetical protein
MGRRYWSRLGRGNFSRRCFYSGVGFGVLASSRSLAHEAASRSVLEIQALTDLRSRQRRGINDLYFTQAQAEGTVRSSTTRSGQGAPGTASKVSLWLVNGRNEPKRVSGSTIRSTLRSAAVRHICSGAWPTSGDKPTSRPRCRTSHIRQSSAALAGSELGEAGRSSLQDVGPDCRGFPCINVSRAVKSLVSSMANSTAGLDSARRSVRRSSCVSLDGNPEITCCPAVTRSTGALGCGNGFFKAARVFSSKCFQEKILR